MIDLEDRLRRTFDAVAEAPLPDVATAAPARPRWPVPAAAAAAAVLLAAGAGVVANRPDPETRAVTGAGRGLADFEVSEAEQHLLVRANRRLVAACMAAAGQPYVDGWPGDVGRLDAHWNVLGRTNLRRAEELGYAIPPDSHGSIPPAVDPITDQDAWRRALTGDGAPDEVTDPATGRSVGSIMTGGCQGEADRAMYGDVVRWQALSRFTFQQRGQVDEAVLADPRLAAGIDAWAGCMADRGRPYPRPTTPPAGFDALASTPPSAEEVATAVDDVECKRSSGLIATYEAVELELGRAVVAEHPDLLAEHRAFVERALDRAEEVLADDEAEPNGRPPAPRFEGTPERLDADVRVEPRKEGLVTLVVTVHAAPSRPASWLLLLVDGKVISSSSPVVLDAPVSTPVPVGDGTTKVRVVATDASGLVVADHGLRSLSGD